MGREGYILRAYRDFCAFHHLTPAEPCAWTWEQAVAFRQGQRGRDAMDKDRRIAAKYFPQEQPPPPQPHLPLALDLIQGLERDVEALMRHRHQAERPGATAPSRKPKGVKSVLDIGSDGKP